MTDEMDSPLPKRPKVESPHRSNSLPSMADDRMDPASTTDYGGQAPIFARPTSAPRLPSIQQQFDPSLFAVCLRPPPSANATESLPFLLPNPILNYNPLNPPRPHATAPFLPAPFNPPHYSPEPIHSVGAEIHRRIHKPPPAETAPSAVHFPLSDSPSKIWAKRVERPLKSNTSTEGVGTGPPLVTTDNANTSNRFILVEQPNDIQRKSYKKENRCLLPNPLIVCLKELTDEQKKDPPVVLDGVVSLKLVNNDGSELPPHKQNALESIEGGLTHPLGDDHTTCFSVKVLQTSEGNLFRLIFSISYRLKGHGRVEEQIVSRPFAVYSNKHNRNSRKKQLKKAEDQS